MTASLDQVITDLAINKLPRPLNTRPVEQDSPDWHRIGKDLFLHTSPQSAWIEVTVSHKQKLRPEDLVLTHIHTGNSPPLSKPDQQWEYRTCGIWVVRAEISGNLDQAVTSIDVLFGVDAVDPRPRWTLLDSPLRLGAESKLPVARLSFRRGAMEERDPLSKPILRVDSNGRFKILQISDTHMVTGVGVCNDAMDAHGNYLPDGEADPRTVKFMSEILEVENPDLVVFTGDQLHHDVSDSQSALFKVVAPVLERRIPFAVAFGNHDCEGAHALSREAQMAILENLPFSLCEAGPDHVDGIGNFYVQILGPAPSQLPISTLYLLDSHGQIPSSVKTPDYEAIKQSQIDWFLNTSKSQRKEREDDGSDKSMHMTLVFQHIPFPEFEDARLCIRGGRRREPTEGPSFNSHFYDALVGEAVCAIGCGHDHVNDFCGLLPRQSVGDGDAVSKTVPWLCYAGGSGFGGYCSYGGKRYHRRMRVWEMDAKTGSLRTWKRVEYARDRVDELILMSNGKIDGTPNVED